MQKNKIRNILVPIDGSKNSFRGLDDAIELARDFHATITGIYVRHMSGIYPLHPLGFLDPSMVKKAKKFLASAKTRAAKKGIVFRSKIIDGNPRHDIVKYAHTKKHKIDLIVIGARGMGSAKEIFLGSTSHYVVHKSKIPILVVK